MIEKTLNVQIAEPIKKILNISLESGTAAYETPRK